MTSIFSLTNDVGASMKEYEGSIADLVEDHSRVQPNSDKLEETFVRQYSVSKMEKDFVTNLSEIKSKAPAPGDRDVANLLPSLKYLTNGWYQLRILMARRIKLIMHNAVTWTRMAIAFVFGTIIGSLFSELSQGIAGALGRISLSQLFPRPHA